MSALYAIVGHPVARSASPAMHNAAFAAVGLTHTYIPLDIRPGAIAEGMQLLRTLDVAGANVTVPHKVDIVPFLTALHGDAVAVGAVNTIMRDGDGYAGHLTDGAGFLAFLSEEGIEATTAVVLGAGGSARAVAYALATTDVRVTVCARRPEQAEEVAGLHPNIHVGRWGAAPSAQLVINATPLRTGLPTIKLTRKTVAVDLIYGEETEFLARARDAHARSFDGSGMLLHQAALSFTVWTSVPAPLEAMRAALDAYAHSRDESDR